MILIFNVFLVQAKLEPNVKPVPPVLKNDKTIVIKDQPARKSQVRQQIFHHASSKSSSGSKRHLGYDPGSNVAGIDPLTLADANQPFLIYSPKTELYLFMSNDKRVLGKKHNTYVEARSERFGGRNEFIIEKSRTGKFYIRNIKTDRYVYVSSSTSGVLKWSSFNVLGSDEYPGSLSDSNQKKKFEFVFEDDDDGFYRIKNNGNYLFVSSDRVGIPANRIVEADVKNRKRDQTQLFQFSLKEVCIPNVCLILRSMLREICIKEKFSKVFYSRNMTFSFRQTLTSNTIILTLQDAFAPPPPTTVPSCNL